MIPTPEQLEAISRSAAGNLGETPYAVLISALALHERSAVVEMRRHQIEKKIVFDHGVPIDCRSNIATETLGRFMVTIGRLTFEQFNDALAESSRAAVPLGEILVARKLITPVELFRILQQNLARKLLDGFTWREGEYSVSDEVPPVDSPLKVNVPQLVLTGIVKFAPQEDVDGSIVPLIGKRLVMNPAPAFSLDEIRLSERQGKVTEALKRGGRIDELAMSADLPYEELTRIVYALAVIGLAVPSDRVPAAQPSARPVTAPPRPAVVSPATEAAGGANASDRKNEVMRAYLSFRKHDAFDLLAVAEDSDQQAIRAAFLRFSRQFAPWAMEEAELRAVADKAEEIFLAGAAAYGELSDPERRGELIGRRRTLREERKREASDPNRFRIKTDLLDPEVQFRKGKALMEAGKYGEAMQFLSFAADCDAQNGGYASELAYCRFLHSPMIVTGNQSLRALRETMRIDAECGLAWYYAGEIHRALGNLAEAEADLRTASRMMAPDRRPIEALKALAAKKK